jgi:threonylcarbamoyladenosine tRNA methylthiotransferase CDKAL1
MVKVHFITQGCSANVSDSEIMAGFLKEDGFEITDDLVMSDVVIFNTCTVKSPTESFFKKKLKELKSLKKKIIITGCIPQADPSLSEFEDCSLVGVYQINNISKIVEETMNGNIIRILAPENKPKINLPKVRKNEYIEIVPVNDGCLGACTFCKTKFARGNLYSYDPKEIVRHISSVVKEGIQEIWLTSQDMGAYGKDIDYNLPKLLKDIISIPGEFRIRVGMANPDFIVDFLDELIWIMKDPKIYSFIHIPVQSGSNDVLKKMARMHSVEDFKYIVQRFREEIPDISIATDIICGFPSETDKDFKQTIELVKETKPDVINISKFWAREGTYAYKMKQLDGKIIKKRSLELTKLFHEISINNNKKWLNKKCKVFVTEKNNDEYIGKNESYKQVIINSDNFLLGEFIDVEIFDSGLFDLKGKVVE